MFQGLYDDLGSRENLVHDLRTYAQPLVELCEEHVAQDIESTLQKATERWNETNDNLKQICDKYKGAVRLWRKYCEDSMTIKNILDDQFSSLDDIMQNKSVEELEVNFLRIY